MELGYKKIKKIWFLLNIKGLGSFLDFIIGIKLIININWATITGLGFIFNGLCFNIVILILSAEGVGTGVFNINSLVL